METSRPSARRRRRLGGLLGAIALAVASLAPSPAEATWRCGRRLVALGDSAFEVLSRCGAPSYRSFSTELVTIRLDLQREFTKVVPVETWTYDRGPHEFVRFLTFRDGFLDDIAESGYGGYEG